MNAEFIAEEGILKGLILSLESGEEWTIGRDPDLCTIVIEDPKASRLHARIRKLEEGYSIESMSTTEPVLLNGEPLKAPAILKEDDLITLGTSVFRFYPKGAPADYVFESDHFFEEEEEEQEEAQTEDRPLEKPQDEPLHEEEPSQEEVFEQGFSSFEPEEITEETLFDESEVPEMKIDLTQTTRFILKVIAGPNTGAEFALDLDSSYLIGTDAASCDIVFNDLSVSREHARLSVSENGNVTIQDLGSRNGVIVDKERISDQKTLTANAVVALGTSAFLLIDREAPSETIAAPVYEAPEEEIAEEEVVPSAEEIEVEKEPIAAPVAAKPLFSPGTLALSLMIGGLAILLGIGLLSLFQTREVGTERKDSLAELAAIIKCYPAIRYTFNSANGKLFLLGHVRNGVEHNELLHKLNGLGFIKGIDDNIVNNEAVWQEMNILLSKHPDFRGVSMHSPAPGVFAITGYLQTEKQAMALSDYLNVNFNYLNLLQNKVVVEECLMGEIASKLLQKGFESVTPSLSNGDLQLTGYVSTSHRFAFEQLVQEIKKMPGIRCLRNFVVTVSPERGVVDLNRGIGGVSDLSRKLRYKVTGYSKHGDVNVNVVINGKILSRGDCLDGYTITSIQPHAIFLEKDGLKYKIEYNTCNSFSEE
jgi:type III secretion system YscD/HrpQ family protein